ncbi:aldo/keto reductase [Sorangium sp. So ce269]
MFCDTMDEMRAYGAAHSARLELDSYVGTARRSAEIEKMPVNDSGCSRREFIRLAGAVGLESSILAAGCAPAVSSTAVSSTKVGPEPAAPGAPPPPAAPGAPERARLVPKRPFGKTGDEVSILALGGYFDSTSNHGLLERALSLGVNYWETTLKWGGKGYGAHFRRNPHDRQRVFLMAKTKATEISGMENDLKIALEDIGTTYIDFFIVQGVGDVTFLNEDVRRWVERAKGEGRLKHFGFATHKNMERCMSVASELGWIDGIMASYNYRLMQNPGMQDAIAACASKGIALTAIKSQGLETNPEATIGDETAAAQEALKKFSVMGVTPFQAKLIAVWSNPAISSICSMMTDETALLSNASASWERDRVEAAVLAALQDEARRTMNRYCAGCAAACESSVGSDVPIGDVMRYLMYARSYGDRARAHSELIQLSRSVRQAITEQDYSVAEMICPQRMAIGKLMREALAELT